MRWYALAATLILWAEGTNASCNWRVNDQLMISGETEQGGLRGTFERTVTLQRPVVSLRQSISD